VTIPEKGEARVYSNNSGFTLREGRSARIFVTGKYLGEFEHSDASQYIDTFDRWAVDRDELIAKRQAAAYYGKYYDTDIYGADDLNDYGEWINTRDYGYVWRPYSNATAGYSDWSPYRYGAWRWVPSYGWSWVNDEPWGWSTYHYGRWIWYNGGWYWTPYGYYRQHRSWWYPALVVLQVFNNNVCWYPLPYRYAYYNYNRHYNRRNGDDDRRRGNSGTSAVQPAISGGRPMPFEPQRNVVVVPPGSSVVAVSINEFGKNKRAFTKLPSEQGRNIIAQTPNDNDEPKLPVRRDINSQIGTDIRAVRVQEPTRGTPIDVGAVKRGDDRPLDKSLRDKIIYGNRPVIVPEPKIGGSDDDEVKPPGDRRRTSPTGAVGRPQAQTDDGEKKEPSRTVIPMPNNDSPPVRSVPRNDEPAKRTEPREPVRRDTPVYVPPTRNDPPQRSEPKSEPQKSEPRRSDPPPQKSEPTKSEPSRKVDSPTKKPSETR
jgi:hypothetical protein